LPAERALPARQVTRLARCLTSPGRRDGLLDDLLRVGRVLLEELGQLRVDGGFHESPHPWIPELRLRLALELGILQLHGYDRRQALAHVFTLKVVLLLLEQA